MVSPVPSVRMKTIRAELPSPRVKAISSPLGNHAGLYSVDTWYVSVREPLPSAWTIPRFPLGSI